MPAAQIDPNKIMPQLHSIMKSNSDQAEVAKFKKVLMISRTAKKNEISSNFTFIDDDDDYIKEHKCEHHEGNNYLHMLLL